MTALAAENRENVARERVLFWGLNACGVAWTLFVLFRSPGLGHDPVGHMLVAQAAWNHPELLLDWWGRVGNTLIYFLPSLGGMGTSRAWSIVLAIATALLTADVARRCGVCRIWLIPLLLWFQPWYAPLSMEATTQVPFGLLLIGGVALWLRERAFAAALAIGSLALVRHEGIALAGLWSGYMILKRQWVSSVAVFLPVGLYNIACYLVWGGFSFVGYLRPNPHDLYGRGSLFYFVPRVLKWAGIPVVLLSVVALKTLIERREKTAFLVGYAAYFAVHSVLFWRGAYATGGYVSFLEPMAPGFAIAAAIGVEVLLVWFKAWSGNEPRRVRAGVIAVGLGIVALLGSNVVVRFQPVEVQEVAMREAADWLRNRGVDKSRILYSHVVFALFYPVPVTPSERWDSQRDLAAAAPGTFVVWDSNFAGLWGLDHAVLNDPMGEWELLQTFQDGVGKVFRKKGD